VEGDVCPMSDRVVYIGSKPVHLYVRAVVTAMSNGDSTVVLNARGTTISKAVDVAELCRRRHGQIAAGLPASVHVRGVEITTEDVERRDGEGTRGVSVIRITLEGEGDVPNQD
jgi:DNA-binding protein Alba